MKGKNRPRRKLPDDRFKGIKYNTGKNALRLFIGIFPPDEYIAYFRDVFRALDKQKRNLKQTPVDQIHLTLKFIGSEVRVESKDMLFKALLEAEGSFPKPFIQINKIQFGFDYQKDPQHILADVENNADLVALAENVHGKVRALRLEDTIRWKVKHANDFHITLGRLKPNSSRSEGRAVKQLVDGLKLDPPAPFQADYMDLVQSILTAHGPIYKKIGRIRL